jgi:hypothetical protein
MQPHTDGQPQRHAAPRRLHPQSENDKIETESVNDLPLGRSYGVAEDASAFDARARLVEEGVVEVEEEITSGCQPSHEQTGQAVPEFVHAPRARPEKAVVRIMGMDAFRVRHSDDVGDRTAPRAGNPAIYQTREERHRWLGDHRCETCDEGGPERGTVHAFGSRMCVRAKAVLKRMVKVPLCAGVWMLTTARYPGPKALSTYLENLTPTFESYALIASPKVRKSTLSNTNKPPTQGTTCFQSLETGERSEATALEGFTDALLQDLTVFQQANAAGTHKGAALLYATAGIPVFPCYGVNLDGTCTCGKPTCDDIGKHPRYARGLIEHGSKDATIDPERIRVWWDKWPRANIGISYGGAGWVVIDVDLPGLKAWRELEQRRQLTRTLTGRSGSGGPHVVYRAPEGTKIGNSDKELPERVHVRGVGGYIIVAPSLHKSGNLYAWVDTRPIALLPDALLTLLALPPKDRSLVSTRTGNRQIYVTGRPLYEGQRNTELYRVASAWRGKFGMGREEILEYLLQTNQARCIPPLPENEVEKIARSAAGYPI